MGDRVNSVFVQLPSPSSSEAERKKRIPKAASRENSARAAVPPFFMIKKKRKEKRESVMEAERGPHAEAQARTSSSAKKERGIKTNKSQRGEEVGTELPKPRSYQNPVWGLELSHSPETNPCPLRAVMCEPYFGKLRQGEPQLPGEAVPAPGESPGESLPVLSRRGVRAQKL